MAIAKSKGLITWRIAARVKILTRSTRLKFCRDYNTTSARAGILASAPNMHEIAREESQENQNGAENTNRENRRIASIAVWSCGGAKFSTF